MTRVHAHGSIDDEEFTFGPIEIVYDAGNFAKQWIIGIRSVARVDAVGAGVTIERREGGAIADGAIGNGGGGFVARNGELGGGVGRVGDDENWDGGRN